MSLSLSLCLCVCVCVCVCACVCVCVFVFVFVFVCVLAVTPAFSYPPAFKVEQGAAADTQSIISRPAMVESLSLAFYGICSPSEFSRKLISDEAISCAGEAIPCNCKAIPCTVKAMAWSSEAIATIAK